MGRVPGVWGRAVIPCELPGEDATWVVAAIDLRALRGWVRYLNPIVPRSWRLIVISDRKNV